MKDGIYHLNDRTMKYLTLAQAKRQHQYLGLPGEFKTRLPQEIVFPNMESGRVDEYYLNDEDLLIDFEEESGDITDKTLDKFAKYIIFASYIYSGKLYLAVLCHKDPKKDVEYYEYSPSLFIKVHYYYFSQDELWKKYENVINKVKQREKLTDKESLDMAFICKFISKKHALHVIESIAKTYKDALIEDKRLKVDVGAIIGGMIKKYIENPDKQKELLEEIDMEHIKSEMEKILYDEFGDQLNAKDQEIKTKDKQLKTKDQEIKTKDKELETKDKELNKLNKSNNEYKKKLKQLQKLTDWNTPEAKKIINSMALL